MLTKHKTGNIMNMKYFFIFLLCIFLFSFISCNSKKNSKTLNASVIPDVGMSDTLQEAIQVDLPISVNLKHTGDAKSLGEDYGKYKIIKETENAISIDIEEEYYSLYTSGKRFNAELCAFYDGGFPFVENLTLELDIVNNSDHTLDISQLDVVVDESSIDLLPVIHICTTQTKSNSITFVNDSWFNWKGMTFSYSLLRDGEKFDGKYKKSKYIPYFEDELTIDLLPDMKEMGYNLDRLIQAIKMYDQKREKGNIKKNYNPWITEDGDAYLKFIMSPDDPEFQAINNMFKPFSLKESVFEDEYEGQATLYGTLKFDNSNHKFDFIATVSLSFAGDLGAPSPENDSFDVKLRPEGKNYTIKFPYTTVIKPYGTEVVTLTLFVPKSSNHKFSIEAKNNNNLIIRSKDIYFHNYSPKSWMKTLEVN